MPWSWPADGGHKSKVGPMSGLHQAQPSPGLWAVTVSHPVQAVGKQRLAQSLPQSHTARDAPGSKSPHPREEEGCSPGWPHRPGGQTDTEEMGEYCKAEIRDRLRETERETRRDRERETDRETGGERCSHGSGSEAQRDGEGTGGQDLQEKALAAYHCPLGWSWARHCPWEH